MIVSLTVGLLVLSIVFWTLERWSPGAAVTKRRAVDTRVDLAYWFFTPIVTRATTRIALALAFVIVAWSHGVTFEDLRRVATSRQKWASTLPIAVQLPLILVIGDLLAYWTHRLFHGRLLWPFHAIHHSSKSPVFHRWHHTSEEEGRDRNFAGLFPVIDLVFGTFYMPHGREPFRFGVEPDDVPDGLLRQLAYPFRRARRAEASPPL
jgi:sterol desaturase/sphingolipid hydroxylase (fatty acid hydroxylase superfamily)